MRVAAAASGPTNPLTAAYTDSIKVGNSPGGRELCEANAATISAATSTASKFATKFPRAPDLLAIASQYVAISVQHRFKVNIIVIKLVNSNPASPFFRVV